MKKAVTIRSIQLLFLLIFIACSTNPIDKIQGIYIVNKDSLKAILQKEMDGETAFAMNLLNTVIENAIIEFEIKGDSINGLLFLAGESSLLKSIILVRNDSLVIKVRESEAYLFPTTTGLSFKNSGSNRSIELKKSEQAKLSTETVQAIANLIKVEIEKREFEQNLGKWQEGSYVDEFGDRTGKGYAFCIIRGTHENSISMGSEVYVKASIQGGQLYFQIFNSTMTLKENFPDSEFGRIKIKYPDGSVETEQIFFYDNTVSESHTDNNNLIYTYVRNNDGEIKLFIDLSTASDYYSDKYQFNLKKNNLLEILEGLKR
jgi:hypothetical protein